jgi:hypothetical protein
VCVPPLRHCIGTVPQSSCGRRSRNISQSGVQSAPETGKRYANGRSEVYRLRPERLSSFLKERTTPPCFERDEPFVLRSASLAISRHSLAR